MSWQRPRHYTVWEGYARQAAQRAHELRGTPRAERFRQAAVAHANKAREAFQNTGGMAVG